MDEFFETQEDLQRQVAQRRNPNGAARNMGSSMIPSYFPDNGGMMDMTGMVGGDTLDDIISQNNKEIQRRHQLQKDRRSSVMEFGSSHSSLEGFQFAAPSDAGDVNLRRQSTGQLEMGGYQNMATGINIHRSQMGFASPIQTETVATGTSAFPVMPTEMVQEMMRYGPVGMDGVVDGSAAMHIFSPTSFSNPFSTSMEPIRNDFMIPVTVRDGMSSHRPSLQENDKAVMMPGLPDLRVSDSSLITSATDMDMGQNMVGYSSPVSPMKSNMPIAHVQKPRYSMPMPVPPATVQQIGITQPEPEPPSDVYSQSGFDLLRVLAKVVTRKSPEINVGKVDLSCAFVVCNMLLADCPIVYVSDVFERMTGYTKFEILGRNCRFLQSPEGKVEAGAHREFVDNNSVYYLNKMVSEKREAQRSLINYRKGGQPFTNLLTIIPITGEDDKEIKYYVGLQVDLVEKPTSVEGKDMNGMYAVDYTQVGIPRYRLQPPQNAPSYGDDDQVISRDDVSTALGDISSNTGSETIRGMWDKVLLENTDDVVHVVSPKGLFLYLSQSCHRILEYDASELVGTALSSICHPSDIVSVTRELKNANPGLPVSVIFRIRRKKSGYTWFESHGSLGIDPGKGRKCIILVGREKPIYSLSRHDIDFVGGINENELWSKLSTSAMFLFVSSNVHALLDLSPDELVGTSLQALMRSESRVQFGRALEKAKVGERVTCKHEILNKRGSVMQAQTRLFPGDVTAGNKPTFLIAQTRILKSTPRSLTPTLTLHSSNHSEEGGSSLSRTPTGMGYDGWLTPAVSGSISDSATQAAGREGTRDLALPSESNIFDELQTTRCTSWQFELRQMEKSNKQLSEELAFLLSNRKKRKRRKGAGNIQRDCANCHTRVTPEWRRGPSGQRDLCNSCGLRWAKQVSRSGSDQMSALRVPAKVQSYQSTVLEDDTRPLAP